MKTAFKNARSYKWLFAIFALITIVALCTLPFADYFESKINVSIERDGIIVGAPDAFNDSELSITYMDVAQGDCILINLPDGKNMLIDAGSSMKTKSDEIENNILSYIKTKLISGNGDSGKLDYLVLTHPDYDHLAYMDAIISDNDIDVMTMFRPYTFYAFDESELEDGATLTAKQQAQQAFEQDEIKLASNVGALYVTEDDYKDKSKGHDGFNVKSTSSMYNALSAMYEEAEALGGEVRFSEPNTTIQGGSGDTAYKFTWYAPVSKTALYKDWNDYSCLIVLEYKNTKICFTGDTEEKLEEDILATYGSSLPNVDIMDAGHHGSGTSSSAEFLAALDPEVVICSCGLNNEYGHPHPNAVQRFLDSGVPRNCIFGTYMNGNIVIGFNYEGEISIEGDTASANTGTSITPYVVGISKDGEVEISETKWWHIVVGIIIMAGVVLLIIVPSVIKSIKKSKK